LADSVFNLVSTVAVTAAADACWPVLPSMLVVSRHKFPEGMTRAGGPARGWREVVADVALALCASKRGLHFARVEAWFWGVDRHAFRGRRNSLALASNNVTKIPRASHACSRSCLLQGQGNQWSRKSRLGSTPWPDLISDAPRVCRKNKKQAWNQKFRALVASYPCTSGRALQNLGSSHTAQTLGIARPLVIAPGPAQL